MSYRVLVIPEDPTCNGYILKPLVTALLADAGKPSARVGVLTNPRLTGYDTAVAAIRGALADRYAFSDLWVFMPDADRANEAAMRDLESQLAARGVTLLCCPAQPEVEIYPCAAYRSELKMPWRELRTAPRLKEDVFKPLLKKHGDVRRAGGGRDLMIEEALRNLPLLYDLCPELAELRDRIASLVERV
jgi:hypothetical protein